MLALRIWNYIRGYVIILVEGYFPEDFINTCLKERIHLWDVRRKGSCSIEMKISPFSVKKIRPIAKNTSCRTKIISKKGIPFFVFNHRKRSTFVVASVLIFLIIIFLSNFIWSIEVVGNEKIKTSQIISCLEKQGLKRGAWKKSLNTEKIIDNAILQTGQLSWMSIDLTGTKAIIEVVERVSAPKSLDLNKPSNIIADRDAIIEELFVKAGTPVVKRGSTVKKGDMLVTGIIEDKYKNVRFVHALADIRVRTWYEETRKMCLRNVKYLRTGNEKTYYSIMINNVKIDIGSHKPVYKSYEIERSKKNLFGIITIKHFETQRHIENFDKNNAIMRLGEVTLASLKKKLKKGAVISNKKSYVSIKNNVVTVRVMIESKEEAGIQTTLRQ